MARTNAFLIVEIVAVSNVDYQVAILNSRDNFPLHSESK